MAEEKKAPAEQARKREPLQVAVGETAEKGYFGTTPETTPNEEFTLKAQGAKLRK